MACVQCGRRAQLRRCTAQRLCTGCRKLPEFRIISRKELIQAGLEPVEVSALIAGWAPNPKNPRFPPIPVYFQKDIERVLSRKLDKELIEGDILSDQSEGEG